MFEFLKNKPKIYKYKSLWGRGHEEYLVDDWKRISEILKINGHRIEVVKIASRLSGSVIYYRYVREEKE